MSQELPEDFKDWPRDPFKLLGIDRHCDLKSAKRAYIKRIKKFKPDKFPAEFQLIHRAFEDVQNWLSWQRQVDGGSYPSDEEAESVIVERVRPIESKSLPSGPNSESSANTIAPVARRPESPSADPFEKFQPSLLSGDLNTAAKLLKMACSHSSPLVQARANLMLYCLLDSVEKKADPNQLKNHLNPAIEKRIGYLLKALDSEKVFFAALTGLSKEFDLNPEFAKLSGVQQKMLNLRNPDLMLALLQLRWRAIGGQDWRVVLDDLQAIEPNSLSIGDSWVQILVESLEYTIWHPHQRCVEVSQRSWKELSENYPEQVSDDLEVLMLAAKQWRALPSVFHGKDLIPFARTLLPREHRRYWEPEAKLIAELPHQSLDFLTDLYVDYPCAINLFLQGLKKYSELVVSETDMNEFDDDYEEDDSVDFNRRDQIACFFTAHGGSNYERCRKVVLDYCVSQRLDPVYFGYLASTFESNDAPMSWKQLILEDIALQCVYYASF